MPDPAAPPAASPGATMDRKVARSGRARLRRWLIPAVTVAAAAALLAGYGLTPASNTLVVSAGEISTATAERASFQDYLPVRATVAPLRTVFVTAVEGGTVERVMVADGASVKAGDVLATLSNPQLRLDVTSREAAIAAQLGGVSGQRLSLQQNLTTQDNAIAETRYNLLKAQRDLAIRQHLHEQGFESDAGIKSFADEADYYRSRLRMLQRARLQDQAVATRQAAEIDQTASRLQSNLDVVQDSLQSLVLRAPVAGRLTDFPMQPGQTLKQGDAIGQIDSEDAYRLDADIDEFYLGRVSADQAASADIDGATVPLRVARVHPQVSGGQFRAELVFAAALPPGLRRGESVETRITLGRTGTALVLPNGAWAEGGGSVAFVLRPDGRHADRRTVASGRRNPEQVEITSGLAPGDRVITSSYARYQTFSRLLVH